MAVGALLLAGAQTADASWRFGIKGGVNFDNLKINNLKSVEMSLKDVNNRTGWTAGIMTEFEVPVVGICADASLMYSRMENSFSIKYVDDLVNTTPSVPEGSETTGNAGRNFIEIPINLKWKLNIPLIAKVIKPYVLTGPDFAFKLDKNPVDAVLKAKTCQVAWNLGLGVELFQHLQITGQYGFGINKAADILAGIKTEDLKVKNNYWTVSAAFLF